MSVNLFNASIGLNLLSGTTTDLLTTQTGLTASASSIATTAAESAAVRKAKAAFTTPATTPPWLATRSSLDSPRLAQVRRMASVVESRAELGQPRDVQTTFTAYKALERLSVLANAATAKTLSESERASLQDVFAKGLTDLQAYLGQVKPDKLTLAFNKPVRQQQTASIPQATLTGTVQARPIAAERDATLAGISGQETLRLSLAKGTSAVDIDVPLSAITGPLTLDKVAATLNDAIAGSAAAADISSRFSVAKTDGKWGLVLTGPSTEKVSIDQAGAGDALMVMSGATNADGSTTGLRLYRANGAGNGSERTRLSSILDGAQDGTAQVKALLTAPDGYTYAIGSAAGDLGANFGSDQADAYLIKIDSEGNVAWQRSLGATVGAEGAALALTAEGDIVITGSITGDLAGAKSADSDLFVARFNSAGEEEFARSYRMTGDQQANAVAVSPSGAIFIGGKSGDDGFVARLDSAGNLAERLTLENVGNESVTALAFDQTGSLLVLGRHDQTARLHRLDGAQLTAPGSSLDLGELDANSLAVNPTDGTVIVAGSKSGGLAGSRDGVVALVDASLGTVRNLSIASDGTDQIDSIAVLNGQVYVGGRTSGALGGALSGRTDAFYGRIDLASSTIANLEQFGAPGQSAQPVRLAAQPGGSNILGALGLHRGSLNPDTSLSLVAQTSLRAGDSFSIRVGTGLVRKITIAANETLSTLSGKLRMAGGYNLNITTPRGSKEGELSIRIAARAGYPIELIAGPKGQDALAKLGLEPARLNVPATPAKGSALAQPGGQYGLSLSTDLNLKNPANARTALDALSGAVSMTKTAYRSLYWDSTKAALVNGASSTALTAAQQAQLDQYNSALQRLSLLTSS